MSKDAQLAQGSTIFIEGETADSWIEILEIDGINPSTGTATEIDCTDLKSTAKEFKTGLVDNGSISLSLNIKEDDPGQAACLAANLASATKKFKVETAAKVRIFSGSVKSWPAIPTLAVDGIQKGTAEIRVSGAVAVTDV